RPWRQTSCSNIQIAASSKQTQLMTGPSFTVGAPCFSRTLVTLNISMALGQMQEVVDVTSEAPQVDTTNTQLGAVT
ncbi:MAG: hypothetical protein ABSG40_22640, partial [Terriglobales bacterium]